MQNHKITLRSDDDEVRSQKSHYTNVSKISSKNVELSLEVEMDDEVREIIKSPEKCTSALLDVTVIKPKGLDKYTTEKQTLKTDQVKKMIASMKLDSSDKKVLMEKLFGENAGLKPLNEEGDKDRSVHVWRDQKRKKSCLSSRNRDNLRQSLMKLEQGDVHCLTDESNSAVYSMYNQSSHPRSGIKTQQQQIYTTPKTYENIRTMFACKNKDQKHKENEKMEQACLCQNCAIVGILTDSQKKAFATEPIPDPMATREQRHRRPSRRKSVSFKHLTDIQSTSKIHEQCEEVFKLLTSRINELERRIEKQEERAVPRDYFKKIITKLVSHLTKLTNYTTEERHMISSPKRTELPTSFSKYRPNDKHRYHVAPVLVQNTYKVPAEKEYDPKPCSSEEPPKLNTESFWKWGEEFLCSGRDLKNKVVLILEETLHNLKKGWEKPETQGRFDEEIQGMVEELSKNLAQTVRPKTPRNRSPEVTAIQSGKRFRSNVPDAKTNVEPPKNLDKKTAKKPSLIPRFMRKKGPTVNVAYVNPRLKRWPEESKVSFNIDSSDYEVQKEDMSHLRKKQYKKEFLKVLDNTKTADKFKLWQNIWNQALENRQTKNDTVTIQIPDPKDLIRQKMINLEYTIGELEKLLTNARISEEKKK